MKKFKKGFTLAEVLISLTIIGVIAAITVPALIQRTQKQEYVTALKKAYSTLSQVTNQIIAEEGSPKGDDGWLQDSSSMFNMYKKHLNTAIDCASNSEAKCFSKGRYKTLARNGYTWDMNNKSKNSLKLADGTAVNFWYLDNTCSTGSGTSGYYGSYNICGFIIVDVNGDKAPNRFSRDAFIFTLKEDGLYPAGCDTPRGYIGECNPNASNTTNPGTGWCCACRVIMEDAITY